MNSTQRKIGKFGKDPPSPLRIAFLKITNMLFTVFQDSLSSDAYLQTQEKEAVRRERKRDTCLPRSLSFSRAGVSNPRRHVVITWYIKTFFTFTKPGMSVVSTSCIQPMVSEFDTPVLEYFKNAYYSIPNLSEMILRIVCKRESQKPLLVVSHPLGMWEAHSTKVCYFNMVKTQGTP